MNDSHVDPRLTSGLRVRVLAREPEPHCRTPYYLRGAEGRVTEVVGRYHDPSMLAYHKPGLPMRWLYRVQFRQADLWPGYAGGANDSVVADLYEHWLEAAGE
ncbi:MAG: SH3-like domain-containing protein [Burkholderiales bacterium]